MNSCSNRHRPAAAPTDALPGSAEKVRVLTERYRLGLPLWHPLDARMPFAGASSDAPVAAEPCAAARVA